MFLLLHRRRLLRAKLWTVLSVPYFEWYIDGNRDCGIRPDRVSWKIHASFDGSL